MLIDDHAGQVPKNRDALTLLPGVGRKTANVVLNEAFGEPTIAVDTHIFRVSNRTGLAPGKTPDHVEAILEKVRLKLTKRALTIGSFCMAVMYVMRASLRVGVVALPKYASSRRRHQIQRMSQKKAK
jgi:adenine-specific DNA glycosylase